MIKVIIIATICSGLWLWIIKRYDISNKKSLNFLLWVGLMGGAFAVEFSWVFNTAFSDLTGISLNNLDNAKPFRTLCFSYFIGFNEELWKLAAALSILKWSKKRVRHPLDIMMLGITVSLGFALWENIMYGNMYSWRLVFWRSLMPGQMIFGVIWSYGLKELYAGSRHSNAMKIFVFSWILAALLHATFDFFVFLGEDWTFYLGISLIWLPVFFFHRLLKNLRSAKEGDRESQFLGSPIPAKAGPAAKTGLCREAPVKSLSRVGKKPTVLAKSIGLSPESMNKLDNLCSRTQKKTGRTYSRNLYLRLIIKKLYENMQNQYGKTGLDFSTIPLKKRGAYALDSIKSVNLSYSTLRMLDEVRRKSGSRPGLNIPRDVYLYGLINRLHAGSN